MADPFTPIALNVQAICSDFGIVTMDVTAQGGLAPLVFEGVADGETLPSGTSYLVVVTDAQGCRTRHYRFDAGVHFRMFH